MPPPSRQNSYAVAVAAASKKELPAIPAEVRAGGEGEAAGVVRKAKKKKIQMPHLSVIPEMVPLFVEMVRPALRPARSASASTTGSLQDVYQDGTDPDAKAYDT
ncbi:unnamed protein product [Tilletia controversa]|nr:unnamed protein product [Tilletia controversa]